LSDSFCHSRVLHTNGIERTCELCSDLLSISHWLICPLRASDRALLAAETGFLVNSFDHIREILVNERWSIAFEHVLSRFFRW
jgi:hypothetical protein